MYTGALIRHLRATSRVVGAREIDGRTAHVVQATRTYDAPPREVWAALTDPERIPRWFLPVSGDLDLGGRFQLEGNAGGTVLRCTPPSDLGVTWEFGGDVSWVDVALSHEAGGTRLVLEHAAFPSPHWDQFGPGAAGVGWDLGLFGLDRFLAASPLDREAFETWCTTERGATGLRESAQGWVDAAIATGSPRDRASAQGRQTAAFYTGEALPED